MSVSVISSVYLENPDPCNFSEAGVVRLLLGPTL